VTEIAPANKTEFTPNVIIEAYKQMFTSLFIGTLISLLCGFALLAPFLYKSFILKDQDAGDPPLIATVLICGALGAFFSALTRLYSFSDLPKILLMREFSLPTTQLLMYSLTPPIVGAIAAVVLYLTFAGHLVTGDLFPDIGCRDDGKNDCVSFGSLLSYYGPKNATSFAKVLVWSFVAGFAERLVPNTLEALSKAVTNSNK
jgi:hypothetical protein